MATKGKGSSNKELEMLKRFSGLNHPNIITLLATYTFNNRFHFIFPAAEYDLLMYWKIHPCPLVNPASANSEGLLWLTEQIRNLVGALAHIHEGKKAHMDTEAMFGRHGDIKPANILWFRSRKEKRGVFIVSDFGIADAHKEETRSIIPGADLPVTPRYRAPECDVRDGRISRAYDVWSLGCVLLEMTCWILGANELRERFKEILVSPYITGVKTDIYFDIHWLGPGGGYRLGVKEQIVKWIGSLHNKPGCSPYVHDLLDIIHEDMLVVDQNRRKSMVGLFDSVDEMHQRAIDSVDYIRAPEPREVIMEARYMDGVDLNHKIESILDAREEKRKQLNEASH
ncbi:Cyclin-dependent kinase-like 4 [Fusarium oxysporum f. sp. rapae]|uniref:Cyclin-dependent kinase-like 4 n=1 Tax=Fusarium oxysporum f. sp. rapae TaxID=485398 RepID=A0A8J5NWR7_FUSOX|nr:Cyclin-dependent kinase-like 4 [Fusarium oxysporum f. sp. rapae]